MGIIKKDIKEIIISEKKKLILLKYDTETNFLKACNKWHKVSGITKIPISYLDENKD